MALEHADYPCVTDDQWEDVVEVAMVIGPDTATRIAEAFDTLGAAKKLWLVGGEATTP